MAMVSTRPIGCVLGCVFTPDLTGGAVSQARYPSQSACRPCTATATKGTWRLSGRRSGRRRFQSPKRPSRATRRRCKAFWPSCDVRIVGGNNAFCILCTVFPFLPAFSRTLAALACPLGGQPAEDLGQRLLQPVRLGVQPTDLLLQRRHAGTAAAAAAAAESGVHRLGRAPGSSHTARLPDASRFRLRERERERENVEAAGSQVQWGSHRAHCGLFCFGRIQSLRPLSQAKQATGC